MACPIRIEFAGALHHVMARDNERWIYRPREAIVPAHWESAAALG